jgi:catechol 2,3-dioxygenase-like lactoylglutathione lyase family enzyme
MRLATYDGSAQRILDCLWAVKREGTEERERRHRDEWPKLWSAIDDLCELVDTGDPLNVGRRTRAARRLAPLQPGQRRGRLNVGGGRSQPSGTVSCARHSWMLCSCCGEERETVPPLQSRDDVQLCRFCVDGLAARVGVTSTPILPVVDMAAAVSFYEGAGFGVRRYVDEDDQPGDFAFVDYDGQSVFDLDTADIDPARNGAGCYLVVHGVDDWHGRMTAAGLSVTPVADQPWGMREFALTDPWGNSVRIGQGAG